MTRDRLSDAAADVVRDTRALADFTKGRNLRVISAGVRPDVTVTFFVRGERDSVTEYFVELTETLTGPELSACRVNASVHLKASGTYKKVTLSFTLIASDYEAQLLLRDLPSIGDVRDHDDVAVSRESLEAAVVLLSTHADDCDGTCTQYGKVPCYADRAL